MASLKEQIQKGIDNTKSALGQLGSGLKDKITGEDVKKGATAPPTKPEAILDNAKRIAGEK